MGWKTAGLAVACLLLAFAGLEAAVRVLGLDPDADGRPAFEQIGDPFRPSSAPGLPFALKPHYEWSHRYSSNPRGYFDAENRVSYRTNGAGFRGPPFEREKSAGKLRIALLGDSLAFGVGVRREHSAAVHLEQELATRSGCAVEVYNFAVPAFATRHEAALLEHIVAPYRPDGIVVWYFLNDPQVEGTLDFLAGDKRRVLPALQERSALARLVGSRLDVLIGGRALERTYREAYAADDPRWQRAAAGLGDMAEVANRLGSPIALFVHPVLFRLDADYPFAEIHAQVIEAAGARGLAAFDLFEAFEGRDGPSLWVHASDPHPNEEAHAVAASFAATKLSGLVPACGGAPTEAAEGS